MRKSAGKYSHGFDFSSKLKAVQTYDEVIFLRKYGLIDKKRSNKVHFVMNKTNKGNYQNRKADSPANKSKYHLWHGFEVERLAAFLVAKSSFSMGVDSWQGRSNVIALA